jgi:hypothetical protein
MAITGPCIKGALFEPVVADILGLVEAGRLTQTALEAQLQSIDLAFLESKLSTALWYPIETYARLLELLWTYLGFVDGCALSRTSRRLL